jgi:hypothetical protein
LIYDTATIPFPWKGWAFWSIHVAQAPTQLEKTKTHSFSQHT